VFKRELVPSFRFRERGRKVVERVRHQLVTSGGRKKTLEEGFGRGKGGVGQLVGGKGTKARKFGKEGINDEKVKED